MPDALPPSKQCFDPPSPSAPDAEAVAAAGAAAAAAFAEARGKGLARGDPVHLLLGAQVALIEVIVRFARWLAAALARSREPLTEAERAALVKDVRRAAEREMARAAWTARWRTVLAAAALWAASLGAVGWACYGLGAARPVMTAHGPLPREVVELLAANPALAGSLANREAVRLRDGREAWRIMVWPPGAAAAPR